MCGNINGCVYTGVSGDGSEDDPGSDIDYGGTDDEGQLNPAARRYHDVWEDEEEEADEVM